MSSTKEQQKKLKISEKMKEKHQEDAVKPGIRPEMLEGTANIEKIRDILFGNQMREYDKRFGRLEERVHKEVTNLNDELSKRFDSLESYIKKEVEFLTDPLKTEQGDRSRALQDLTKDMKDTAALLEKKLEQSEEQFNKRVRDLNDALLAQSKNLSDEIRKKNEELAATLAAEAQELRSDKVDRAMLSEILMEMAMRLSDAGGFSLDIVESEPVDE